ncbi:Arm DNA-binding domain-containing protein [Thauera sp. Sel9]|uniref:Arm DNA-binding domain-containing protein n=1 Tax=Thauera sp. Sel9 TaxID=2974299 RepID=UPI0021E116DE|nr:Arm DNA-binding domain-containing protein [Thauera sp. Sel9]MCV2218517.1 Arm DNA-binding domain-containing protein [Thauera sp. Sel9]
MRLSGHQRVSWSLAVSPAGTVTFRYDYRLNGRRETLTIGRYGPSGISLAMARELLLEARKTVLQGISPALEKHNATSAGFAPSRLSARRWRAASPIRDGPRAPVPCASTSSTGTSCPIFQNRLLTEIQAGNLRILCNKVKAHCAPATAIHVRDSVKQVAVCIQEIVRLFR